MRVIVMTSLAVEWLSGAEMPLSLWRSLVRDDDVSGKEWRVRKSESCKTLQVARCEDCRYWEPIPYHVAGGECLVDGEPLAFSILAALESQREVDAGAAISR